MVVFVAGSVVPVGAALKAGEPVTRAFIAGVGRTSVTTAVGVGTNFVVAPIATSLAKSAGIDPIWANDIGIGTGLAIQVVRHIKPVVMELKLRKVSLLL